MKSVLEVDEVWFGGEEEVRSETVQSETVEATTGQQRCHIGARIFRRTTTNLTGAVHAVRRRGRRS
jgi:hypothetical protein